MKEPIVTIEREREKTPLEKKRDKAVEDARKSEETANALAGARELLGNLTIDGFVKSQGKDFAISVATEVRERYDKASEEGKKNFKVADKTKKSNSRES